jgi:RES domain-containing protein
VKTAWRLVKKAHERDAFTGEGARRYGGRWNERGTAVVYVSGTVALAVLEVFVHLGGGQQGLVFATFEVEIPNSVTVEVLVPSALPANWRAEPPPTECMALGTKWVKQGHAAVLEVPSVVIPRERNYVLNIGHADFAKLKITQRDDFTLDSRMWK